MQQRDQHAIFLKLADITRKEKHFEAGHALQNCKWSCGHTISPIPPTRIKKLPYTPSGFQTIPNQHIDTFKYSFFPKTIITWKNLPPLIPQASTFDAFNRSVNSLTPLK